MEEPTPAAKPSFWKKPFALWVIFGGLLYFGLSFLTILVPTVVSNPAASVGFFTSPLGASFLVFIALFFVAAFLSLKAKRWTMVLAAAVSIAFLGLFSSLIVPTLANPADPSSRSC